VLAKGLAPINPLIVNSPLRCTWAGNGLPAALRAIRSRPPPPLRVSGVGRDGPLTLNWNVSFPEPPLRVAPPAEVIGRFTVMPLDVRVVVPPGARLPNSLPGVPSSASTGAMASGPVLEMRTVPLVAFRKARLATAVSRLIPLDARTARFV